MAHTLIRRRGLERFVAQPAWWLLTALLLAGPAAAQRAEADAAIVLDAQQPAQAVLGFGAQIWAGDRHAGRVLEGLGLRFARMTVGPNWPNASDAPPVGATRAQMDAFLEAHFDADGEPRRAMAKASFDMADRLGVQIIAIQFPAPVSYLSTDGQNRLLPERVGDFARYWGALVAYLDRHGMRPPWIELTNEPDGTWNTLIPPATYSDLVVAARRELDARGYGHVKIVGPGLAFMDHDDSGRRWVGALSPEAVAGLGGWSTHVWDEKFQPDAGPGFIPRRWADLRAAIRHQDPDRNRPIFVTEYATGVTTLAGVAYDGVESRGDRRVSDSRAYAQRVYQQTLQHLLAGAAVPVLWEAADQPWSHHAWGMITGPDAGSRPRPVYHALGTLMPHVPAGARVLPPTAGGDPAVTALGLATPGRLIVALANGAAEPRDTAVVIRHAPGLTLRSAERFTLDHGVTPAEPALVGGDTLRAELPAYSTLTVVFDRPANSPR